MTGAPFGLPRRDRDSAPFWDATARHELRVQRCSECSAYRWPERAICGGCGSLDWEPVLATGEATVGSWVVTRHRFAPGAPSVYTVVLGRLREQADLAIPATWGGAADGSDLELGAPIRVAFDDVPDGEDGPLALLRWIPQDGAP